MVCEKIPGVSKEQVKSALAEVISEAVLDEMKDFVDEKGALDGMKKIMNKIATGEDNVFLAAMVENIKENLTAKGAIESGVNIISGIGTATKPIQDVLFLFNKLLNKVETGFSLTKTVDSKATYFTVKH